METTETNETNVPTEEKFSNKSLKNEIGSDIINDTEDIGTEVKQSGESTDIRGNRQEVEAEGAANQSRKVDTTRKSNSKLQEGRQAEPVQERAVGGNDRETQLYRRGEKRIENRTLKDVYGLNKFEK